MDDSKLVIVGPDDGYLPALKKLIKELKIEDKVLFTGPLYGKKKLEAYVDADVYVLPSIYETFPIAVLEAWACGIPVVLSDACGIARWAGGKIGIVIPTDVERLKDALREVLMNNRRYKDKVKKTGTELLNLSWQRIAEKFEEIYRKAMNGERI